MTTQSHIKELVKRHKKIEDALRIALMHPSVDPLEIRALKQQKLMLKDEITRLERLETMGDTVAVAA